METGSRGDERSIVKETGRTGEGRKGRAKEGGS
jgi:hypothetical protein